MKSRRVPTSPLLALASLFLTTFLLAANPLFAAEQTIQNGPDSDGTIRVAVVDNGNMAVWIYDSSEGGKPEPFWVRQTYGPRSKGSIMFLDGSRNSSMQFGAPSIGATNNWTPVSNSAIGNTITTVFTADSGNVKITQTTAIGTGSNYYQMRWDIENIGASTYNDLLFAHGEDTYLDGDDDGTGHFSSAIEMVYTKSAVPGSANMMGLYADSSTPLYLYFQGRYDTNFDHMINWTMDNTVNPAQVDAGYSIGWERDTLNPGETWTIIAYEKFLQAVGVMVLAPSGQPSVPNTMVDYAFSVQNLDAIAADISLSAVSLNGWSVEILDDTLSPILGPPAPDTITLAAGAEATIYVRVTIPAGATPGMANQVTLTATSGANSSSDTTSAEVRFEPPVPIKSNKYFRGSGGCGSIVGSGGNDMSGLAAGAGQAAIHFAVFLISVALLKLWWRFTKKWEGAGSRALPIIFITLLLTVATYAQAGGIGIIAHKAQRFNPTMDNLGTLTAESDKTIGAGKIVMGVHLNVSHKPFNAGDVNSVIDERLVKRLNTANLTAAYGITQNIQVGIDLPFNYAVNSINQTNGKRENDFSIGDIRLNAKFNILSRDTYGLALIPFITFPSGNEDFFLSQRKAGYGMKAASHLDITKDLTLYGNFGLELLGNYTNRESPKYHEPWIKYAFGVSYRLMEGGHRIIAELNGETILSKPFNHERVSPVELLAAWRNSEILPGYTLQLGAGTGLNDGAGSPQWRLIAGLYRNF